MRFWIWFLVRKKMGMIQAHEQRRAAYYVEAQHLLDNGSYWQNVDPAELTKLVHADVVFGRLTNEK